MERLLNNLSIIDNLPLYKVDMLIATYIYKMKCYLVRFDFGYRVYVRVMYDSVVAQSLPRTKKLSYARDNKYPINWYEFYRVTQLSDRAIELANRLDAKVYLTFDSGKVISTIYNKYQVVGSFAEVLAKTCLLQYFESFEIDLQKENLGELLKEQDSKEVMGLEVRRQNLNPKPRLLKNLPKRD
jgi:hypothetical protein